MSECSGFEQGRPGLVWSGMRCRKCQRKKSEHPNPTRGLFHLVAKVLQGQPVRLPSNRSSRETASEDIAPPPIRSSSKSITILNGGLETSLSTQLKAANDVLSALFQDPNLHSNQKVDLGFVHTALRAALEASEKGMISKSSECKKQGGPLDQAASDITDITADVTLDADTKNYLVHTHGKASGIHRFREVSQAIIFGIRRRQRAQSGDGPDITMSTALMLELSKCDTWGNMDVFNLTTLSSNQPLRVLSNRLLHDRGLLRQFGISDSTLNNWLTEVEEAYKDNPYHNRIHGADVTHSMHVLLRMGLEKSFSELEIMAALLSAICHDVAHPGVTNAYRCVTGDEDAILYNDRSVNENVHTSTCFRYLNLLYGYS